MLPKVQLALNGTLVRESTSDQRGANNFDRGKLPMQYSRLFCRVSMSHSFEP